MSVGTGDSSMLEGNTEAGRTVRTADSSVIQVRDDTP